MKYFIYLNRSDASLEVVQADHIDEFRDTLFNPAFMEFSGVVVETDTFQKAVDIYSNPNCGFGECFLTDEPPETLAKRTEHSLSMNLQETTDEVANNLDRIRCSLTAQLALAKMMESAELFWRVSLELHKLHNYPTHATPDDFYKLLTDAAIKKSIQSHGKPE
jgi:hypothetical protein